MRLENDSFRITYDPEKVSVAAILEKIRALGYKPEERAEAGLVEDSRIATDKPLPDLVASAIASSAEEGKLLLLDFYASWCAPCDVLEKRVFGSGAVKRALEEYRVIKIDTDRHPQIAEYFKIRALPTLMVLDAEATNRYRHMGLIDADDLVRELANAARREEPVD